MMKLPMTLTISRIMGLTDEEDCVNLRVRDSLSQKYFLDIRMKLVDFAKVTFGLAEVEIVGDFDGFENIGKQKIIEEKTANYPGSVYDFEENIQSWVEENCLEQGELFLGPANSNFMVSFFVNPAGEKIFHYLVVRFETVEDPFEFVEQKKI